ncbi:GspH/FimT family pseudopilin [Microbulbifer sp. 2201CG32-9]|uniref:GspH/FimT family pseudopilin n=1 Tax=unclassified Microbulbifer TaxID=2619833 RepID=UPI00345B8D6E
MTLFRRSAGFTLVELMFTIAILGIVMAIGVPSFTTMIQNNRLTAAFNDLAGALHFARAEAVRRGEAIRVDAIDNNISNGLRVWYDKNGDNGMDAGEELRLVRLSAASGVAVSGELNGSSEANLSISYSPRGVVSNGGSRVFTLCDDRSGNHGKTLELLASGLLRPTSGIACNHQESAP